MENQVIRHSFYWLRTVLPCCLLAACGNNSGQHDVTVVALGDRVTISRSLQLGDLVRGKLRLEVGDVRIHADGAPDATISADGKLQIGQQAIAVDALQQQLLQQYYGNASAIAADGLATGKAGAEVGEQAAKSVATRLLSGEPDRIQQDIEAKTKLVTAAAAKICQDLGKLQAVQDQLAVQLPAFKPYGGVVMASDVDDCTKGVNKETATR
jgi:hypothetical protein